MDRVRSLGAVLAALALLVAYRARATPPPPMALPCLSAQVGLASGIAQCGAREPVSVSAGKVLGIPLDLNRATEAELEALPGVGAKLAARIIEVREASGPFRSVADLERVNGIGPGKRHELEGRVGVGGNPAP